MIPIFINPKSRRGSEWHNTIAAQKPADSEVILTESKEQFDRLIHQAVQQGQPEVWVGGGDGTLRQAAQHLVNTQTVLGILPLGTGNALANELGMPASPEEMMQCLSEGSKVVSIDVGSFNDSIFINVATLGLSVRVARSLDADQKRVWGRLAYLPALVHAVQNFRGIRCEIRAGQAVFSGKLAQMVVGSSRTHAGPFPVTPEASVQDGLLSVYVLQAGRPIDLAGYGFKLLTGAHTDLDQVWNLETASLSIHLNKPYSFVLDGDKVRTASATVKVLPKSLRVRVPIQSPLTSD